jgi:lysine biosynthesis protein LysW
MGRKAKCPVCEERFELDPDLEMGDTTDCPGCCGELKILQLDPPQLEEVAISQDEYEQGQDGEDNDYYEKSF